VEGGEAAHDCRPRKPMREVPGARSGVRAPAGDTQNSKAVKREGRCQLDHLVGPIDERATGLKVRETHARPVDRDQPDAPRPGRLVAEARLDPRSGPAVEKEERPAAPIAPFRIAQ
jgi:hypothetical protein